MRRIRTLFAAKLAQIGATARDRRDNRTGEKQDFALADGQMWPRVVVAAASLGLTASRVELCALCGT
jgi:hypothetical protein